MVLAKGHQGMFHVVLQWLLDYGYYNGVKSTIGIANGLHAIFHMVSQSSSLSNHFHNCGFDYIGSGDTDPVFLS